MRGKPEEEDPNHLDKFGWTPLIRAARFGHVDTCRHLLEKGARLNHQNDDGETALITAAKWGKEDTVRMLLQQPKINIHLKDKDGNTAADRARQVFGTKDISEAIEGNYKAEKKAEMDAFEREKKRKGPIWTIMQSYNLKGLSRQEPKLELPQRNDDQLKGHKEDDDIFDRLTGRNRLGIHHELNTRSVLHKTAEPITKSGATFKDIETRRKLLNDIYGPKKTNLEKLTADFQKSLTMG